MKAARHLLKISSFALNSTFSVALLILAQAQASTVIYFDNFDNADDVGSPAGLDGDTPTIATSFAGGSGAATWSATNQWQSDGNKSFGTANGFLPVSIPSNTQGGIYSLSLEVIVAASSNYDWLAAGFATTTSGLFWDMNAPWMLMRGQTTLGGGSGVNASPNTVVAFRKMSRTVNNSALLANQFGPYSGTFRILLDTSSQYWHVSWEFRETGGSFQEFHSHVFSASDPNPNITHVRVGSE